MRHLALAILSLTLFTGPAFAQLATSPTSLDFGGQSMSTTSPALTVTVTNNGAGTVTVSNVAVADAQFAQTNDCTTLAASASCAVQVTFTPAVSAGDLNAEFPVSSSLTITSDAPGSPNTVPLAGIAERSLVTHYYRSILRRPPDTSGKKFWQDDSVRMAGLDANVNEAWFAMAQFFYFSAEYKAFNRDNTGFVTDLYNTFFNRAPDASGLAFWTDQLAQGMPPEVVLASFMFSNEFRVFTQNIFGAASVRPEVDMTMDFYRGFLARLPDDGGLASYAEVFRAEQCKPSPNVDSAVNAVYGAIAGSSEATSRNRTNAQYVGDVYNAILRRGGDLGGVQFWINQLNTGAMNRGRVGREFLASPEFVARSDAVEAAGCVSRGTMNQVATTLASTVSVAFGGDGLPIIAHGALSVARCADAACASGIQSTTIDGPFSSLVMKAGRGGDGLPFIGYSQFSTASQLYSVKCGTPSCAGLNTYSFLQGTSLVGLAMLDGAATGDDRPLFVYSSPSVVAEKCADAACTTSTRTGFGGGTRAGVAVAGGLPVIAFAAPNAGVKVIKCGNASCTSGNALASVDPEVSQPDNNGTSPEQREIDIIAVAIGSDGFPVLAYGVRNNITRRVTKLVKCGNASCSAGNVITEIDASLDGGWVSLAVPADGRPVVAYRTSQSTLKVLRCGNAACTSGNTATTLPGIGYPVYAMHMTLAPSGVPFLAFMTGDYHQLPPMRTLSCNAVDCR